MIVRQAAVEQGFAQTLVGVFELDVFADDRDAHFAGGMVHAVDEIEPGLQIAGGSSSFSRRRICASRPSLLSSDGHGVNGVHIFHGNDAGFGDVAEQRDFFLELDGNVAIAAAKQNVRLNPDAQHFLHAVLRGLGFQFAGGGDEGNQRDVNEERVFRAEFQAHLADGFEEGKRFDVADGAADFDDDDVHAFGNFFDGGFDFVGDVRE